MSRMSFEELFRKHLSDYREAPRAEVWAQLSRKLEARKRRRRLAWWMSSAAVVAGLTAFTLWLRHESRGLQTSESFSVPSASPLSEVSVRENTVLSQNSISPAPEPALTSEQSQTAKKGKRLFLEISGKPSSTHHKTLKHYPSRNLTDRDQNHYQHADISEGPSQVFQVLAEKNNAEADPTETVKNEEPVTAHKTVTENDPDAESEIQQQEKTNRRLPIFIGLSYEAGSLWRLNPVSATPGLWMPAENMETLPGSKGSKATSFSDVVQAVQLTAGYRFSDVLAVHLSLGHTRIRHFESGNLLNRALPSAGELGLMTGTGAFRVGGEAVSDTSVVLTKLSQHFSFVTLAPGVTYNLPLKQWVLGFNAGIQLHVLASNRAEATFAHTTRTYRHEGLRPFNASLNAGISVGYRVQRWIVSVGFQGGYWMSPLSRRGFAGASYLQMGIRPSVIYNF